jgi:trk system potassium uptake protein TrkA
MGAKRVLVIGVGRFGTALVETLWRGGAEVVVVDASQEAVDSLKDRTSHAFVGDGTNPTVLEGLTVDVDVAVVTFGMAFEATVLAVATLRRLKVPYIVARAETPRRAEILETVGAHRVVQIEAEAGGRLGRDLLTPVASELLDLADEYRVVPWVARGTLVGRTLAEAGLRRRYDLTVLGYRRPSEGAGRSRLVVAKADYVIAEGDTLLIVGEEKHVEEFLAQEGRGE